MIQLTLTRRLTSVVASGALACTMGLAGASLAQADPKDPNSDAATAAGVDSDLIMVSLSTAPLSTSSKVDRKPNKKVDLDGTKTKNERAVLAKQRNDLRKWMKTNAPKATVTSEFDFALNAVAVRLNGTSATVFAKAPGVVDVSFQQVYRPTASDPDLARIDALPGWSAAGATSVKATRSTVMSSPFTRSGVRRR